MKNIKTRVLRKAEIQEKLTKISRFQQNNRLCNARPFRANGKKFKPTSRSRKKARAT
jgi:hypothetical protein